MTCASLVQHKIEKLQKQNTKKFTQQINKTDYYKLQASISKHISIQNYTICVFFKQTIIMRSL